MSVDVLIVGASTAGLAAAIAVRLAGFNVVVCDHCGPDFDKPCGEGLAPSTAELLQRLGVVVSERSAICGIKYMIDGAEICYQFQSGPGHGIRRKILRRAMWDRAESLGVRIENVAVHMRDLYIGDDHVVWKNIRARYLIAADGIHSRVARHCKLRVRSRTVRWGIRRHFQLAPFSDSVLVYWHPYCEAYVTPVGPETINVAILSWRSLGWDEALSFFPDLQRKLIGSAASPLRGSGPLSWRTKARTCGPVLLVGDAAGFEDAITGEGNRLAIESAFAASEAIVQNDLTGYERRWRTLTRRYRLATRTLMVLSKPGWRRKIFLRLVRRMPAVMAWGAKLILES